MQEPKDFRIIRAQRVCQLVAKLGPLGAASELGMDRSEVYRIVGENPDLASEAGIRLKKKRKRRRGPRTRTSICHR